MTTSQLL